MSTVSSPPRALLSVYDKTGIVEFATELDALGFELLSTGGTARTLMEAGLNVTLVSDVTQHPEIFDGRVKSLHPAIHGPLLARLHQAGDATELTRLGYAPIRVVACNLYPFGDAAATVPPLSDDALLEMIDIGGPTMVRASAKNHRHVLITTNPARYGDLIEALQSVDDPASVGMALRQSLALEAFEHMEDQRDRLPQSVLEASHLVDTLRYGENGHQAAALYVAHDAPEGHTTLVTAHVEGGKAMSYNNYSDADATLRLCRSLSTDEWPSTPHACVIVKHNNPCGAALGATQLEAFEMALASDPESAFGSIICFNEVVEEATAEAVGDLFVEVMMAPGYTDQAKTVLMAKKNRRLLTIDSPGDRLEPLERQVVRKPIEGGVLVQTEEPPIIDWSKATTVTKIEPTPDQLDSMKFAVRVCEQVKSNAIVMVQGTATVGIGPGQTSRVEAVKIAARRAGERAKNCVLASDAFFPFKDGLEQAAEAGASAIVQPGGSIRDQEVIDEADARGVAMLFTGHRLFRH